MASDEETPPPTSAVLMSISKHLAARCSKQSKAFIECKRMDKNPETCLKQGDEVTACAIET
jgi:NADH dehydrogenase (ubiquinone) 1 alpha subcomplex subunit 8